MEPWCALHAAVNRRLLNHKPTNMQVKPVSSTTKVVAAPGIPAPPQSGYRVNSIDLLRGLVMIIMALDHTRDFFHVQAFTDDPLNLSTTTPALFFTRWITHFCAPVFVFLVGTSAYLQGQRKSKGELSSFLVKRGHWLIIIELTVITLGITFDVQYSHLILQTIWAIGISMVLLGLAIWLPFTAILAIGLLIVFGHNLLDAAEASRNGQVGVLWSLLHRQSIVPLSSNHTLMILYPFLSWTGLMFLGYVLGRLFSTSVQPSLRKKTLTALGLGAIALFILLRSGNFYGDPLPWSPQKDVLYSTFSFINTQKYPPSLLFLCMTIGPALLFLAFVGKAQSRMAKIITVYGRVPFFYYVLHFYLLHFLTTLFFMARGHSFSEGLNSPLRLKFVKPGEGLELWQVYLVWLTVVAALYPVCKWFSTFKQHHKQWWLSYL
jgi:uncharacterized membrane protein